MGWGEPQGPAPGSPADDLPALREEAALLSRAIDLIASDDVVVIGGAFFLVAEPRPVPLAAVYPDVAAAVSRALDRAHSSS